MIPLDLLPRWCPVCRDDTIIGHGRRLRKAHADRHGTLWVRRGICPPCKRTFTVLPDWLVPKAQFSLPCRQQACERIAAGDSIEQATPQYEDPARSPDPSTVRRWAWRRLLSVWCWAKTGSHARYFLRTTTILAWDLGAVCRSLRMEANSP